MHRKDVVDKIGYWKNIHETYSYPRVDFFRQAQYKKLSFEVAAAVTALKFLWDENNYSDVGPQAWYFERLKNEPDFLNTELSWMLIRAEHSVHSFPSGKRLGRMLTNPLRRLLLRFHLDPASLKFWNGKGTQINQWRKRHGLPEVTFES